MDIARELDNQFWSKREPSSRSERVLTSNLRRLLKSRPCPPPRAEDGPSQPRYGIVELEIAANKLVVRRASQPVHSSHASTTVLRRVVVSNASHRATVQQHQKVLIDCSWRLSQTAEVSVHMPRYCGRLLTFPSNGAPSNDAR